MSKQITVSYSEIQSAARCSFQHQLAWIEGWSREKAPDSALGFGTAWHAVLDAYYMAKREGQPMWRAGKAAIEEQDESIRDKLRWMLEGYAAKYGREEGWTCLAVEQKLIVPLPKLADLDIYLKVKIDLVMLENNTDHVYVDDHKSCAQLPTEANQIDPQLLLYLYALNVEEPAWLRQRVPFGARYSYSRKPPKTFDPLKPPKFSDELDSRFRRRLVHHTLGEIKSAAEDAYKLTYTRYEEAARMGGSPPRTVKPECNWCDFFQPCKAGRKGYDTRQFLRDYGFSPWREEWKAPEDVPSEEGV